jgi:hypothetical protein
MTAIEKRLDLLVNYKDFDEKYLKNIVIDFCHGQSLVARTKSCNICRKGITLKEYNKMGAYDYGVVLGRFYNKRHKRAKCQVYFTPYVCLDCVAKIEGILNFKFKKSHAP